MIIPLVTLVIKYGCQSPAFSTIACASAPTTCLPPPPFSAIPAALPFATLTNLCRLLPPATDRAHPAYPALGPLPCITACIPTAIPADLCHLPSPAVHKTLSAEATAGP